MEGGEEVQGGLRQTAGKEEGAEESRTCSCAWFKLEGTSPAVGSKVGADPLMVLACKGKDAVCRGWAEWMEAGAVLGPGSNRFWFCLSSVNACCKLIAPADWDNPKPWPGV